MAVRKLGSVMTVLGIIDSCAKRFYDSNGNFDSATFDIDDEQYRMLKNGDLYRFNCSTFEYEFVSSSWCKCGIYPEYRICNCPIKAYVLSKTLSDDKFYELYMSDSSLVVNHMVTERGTKVFRDIFGFAYKKSKVAPKKSVSYNPDYLECIKSKDNIRHGKFIYDYGLFGIRVSANDIDDLLKTNKLINLNDIEDDSQDYAIQNNISIVKSYYEDVKHIGVNLIPA